MYKELLSSLSGDWVVGNCQISNRKNWKREGPWPSLFVFVVRSRLVLLV